MKGKFLRHGDHEDRNLSAGNIYGKEDEVMQNKIKYQRKTHVHQAKKKNLWKTMANYRDFILHYPASQGNARTQRVKDIIYHFASI